MTDQTPVLTIESVEKSFGTTAVLQGVSVTLHEGEVVALLGASGSGKPPCSVSPAASSVRMLAGSPLVHRSCLTHPPQLTFLPKAGTSGSSSSPMRCGPT